MGMTLQQHANAVGQTLDANGVLDAGLFRVGLLRRAARRRDRDAIEPPGQEVTLGDVANLFGRDLLDVFGVLAVEQGIISRQVAAAEALGHLLDRLTAENQLGRLLLLRLG